MKNQILTLALITFALSTFVTDLSGQAIRFKAGQLQANAGIGLVSTFAADAPTTVVPPVSASVEYFLSRNFSLGLYAAYSHVEGEREHPNAGLIESFSTETRMIGLRTGVHSNNLDNWRVYGGFTIGASVPTIDKTVTMTGETQRDDDLPSFSRPAQNSFLFSGYVGARRYFRQDWSAYGELGFGISLVNVGLSYHF